MKENGREKNIRNLEVGETFYFDGHKLKVVEETNSCNCQGCFIFNVEDIPCCDYLVRENLLPECVTRQDGKDVIFLEEREE